VAKTDAQDWLKEAKNISKSHFAVGDVISSLANKSQRKPCIVLRIKN
jgi:hypothetical protein